MENGQHERWMRRALALAARGRGHAEPNPLVGCVIVRGGQVLGEGFHEHFGGPHAEINALSGCREDPAGAVAYSTLEPCCHTNKKTPPCVPRLIGAKVKHVVIGCLDPNPQVNGEGVRQLRAAGVEVTAGVLEPESRQLLAPYLARVLHNRPYVTLKWAVSADGKIAGHQGRPVRITNDAATAAGHALRGRCDAIAVGTNTLVNDDPMLTARTPNPPRRPIRVVLSNRLTLPPSARLFRTPAEGPILVYTTAHMADSAEAQALRELHVEVVGLPGADNGRGSERFAMSDVYADLAQRGVTHLLIEAGASLAREMIARRQADRVWIFSGQADIGDDGLGASTCPWPVVATADLDGDVLSEHLNPDSDVFFALTESPDLLLTR